MYISSQLQVQCYRVGSFKWALVGIFITREISKCPFFPLGIQLSSIYCNTTTKRLPYLSYTKTQRKAKNRPTKIMWWWFNHSVVSDSFATPWTVAHQAPQSMGFPRQEYWSGLLFPSLGDPSDPTKIMVYFKCLYLLK